jgi:hypothetical protein
MSTKVVPVQYDDTLVPNVTTTIINVNGNWSVSSTSLIKLYKDLADAVPGFTGIKRVVVKGDIVFLYSQI